MRHIPSERSQADPFQSYIDYTNYHLDMIFSFNFEDLNYNTVFHYILELAKISEDALADILNQRVNKFLEDTYIEFIMHSELDLLIYLQKSWQNANAIIYVMEPLLNRTDYRVNLKCSVRNLFYSGFHSTLVIKSPLKARIKAGLYQYLARERNGEENLRELIRTIVEILIKSSNNSTLLYQELFESLYIQQASEYLKFRLENLEELKDLDTYNSIVEDITNTELIKIHTFGQPVTEIKIRKMIEDCFSKHKKLVIEHEQENIYNLIENDQVDQLRRKYNQLSREVNFSSNIQQHLKESYTDQLNSILSSYEKKPTFLGLIEESSKLTEKYMNMISIGLNDNPAYIERIQQESVNSNPHYIYSLGNSLKNLLMNDAVTMTDQAIQAKLQNLYGIFRNILADPKNKDFFMDTYVKILLQTEYVKDTDRQDILKSLDPAQFDIVQSIHKLLDIIKISRDFNSLGPMILMNVRVHSKKRLTKLIKMIRLPDIIAQTAGMFKDLLLQRQKKNKIYFKTEYGSADMIFSHGNKKYELIASTYQMCILMLFNDQNQYSYLDIKNTLGLMSAEFEIHLKGLLTANLLIKDTPDKNINPDSVLSFNNQFKSNQRRLEVSVPYEQLKESNYQIDNFSNREFLLQATISKILKLARTLNHSALLTQVSSALQKKFVPTQREIKTAIDTLITKEYIERDKNDSRLYNYIP